MRMAGTAALALILAAPALAVPADFHVQAGAIVNDAFPADGPGAIVFVVEKGRPVYAVGRGLADVEAKVPLDPQMSVRFGSITKQFTAALIMKLAEEGKLSLDDPLSKFLPDFPRPGADVSVRQLLNHTGGIFSYTALPGAMITHAAEPHGTAEMIALFETAPPGFAAGSDWSYSNSGYVLLGAIAEQITGRPWHVALSDKLLRPLGLESIRYGALPGAETGSAKGYTQAAGKPVPALGIHMSFPHAAGSLVGTAADLAKWGRALHMGKVVSPNSYAQMIAPTKLPGGRVVPYGFGLSVGTLRGLAMVGHNGGIPGFQTDAFYLPEADIYVAVLANSDRSAVNPELVTRRLAAAAVGRPFPRFEEQPLDPAAVIPFIGLYEGGGVERRLFLRDGQLHTERKGGQPIAVVPAGGNRFFYRDSLSWFTIEPGPGGKSLMRFHADGEEPAATLVRQPRRSGG